jgi:hypothetical protein
MLRAEKHRFEGSNGHAPGMTPGTAGIDGSV